MKSAPIWERDEGYSGELTARKITRNASLAVVICPPDAAGNDGWEIQVFDEDNEEAMEYGETICRVDLPRWIEEDDAVVTAEALFF